MSVAWVECNLIYLFVVPKAMEYVLLKEMLHREVLHRTLLELTSSMSFNFKNGSEKRQKNHLKYSIYME